MTFVSSGMHVREGGSGEPVLLLLHGLGATGAVWEPFLEQADKNWPGRWLAPDLRGHGRSSGARRYSPGSYAADLAALLAGAGGPVTVVGHSMGGLIGLVLASTWFGSPVACTVALAVRLSWTPEELVELARRGGRSLRVSANRDDAAERYLRLTGMHGSVAPDSAVARDGICQAEGGYRMAADPAVYEIAWHDVPLMRRAAQGQVVVAGGRADPVVPVQDLRELDPRAVVLPVDGHDVHVRAPDMVWELLRSVGPPRSESTQSGPTIR
jgi:pimeloyl-ACP methyl ester carboxylesterase